MNEDKLTAGEKAFLLDHARKTVARRLGLTDEPLPSETEAAKIGPHVMQNRGCFVTIYNRGRLRGCIGIFESVEPLYKTVGEMAQQAAFGDPRFPSLKAAEYEDIDFEISVLTPLRPVDSVDEITVGVHGIYITRGYNRGVLLPQVATEQGWDRDTFLDHTCMKAGMRPGCWRDPDTRIEVFGAEVFGEKE